MNHARWVIVIVLGLGLHGALAQSRSWLSYPYGSPVFTGFITDSYKETRSEGIEPFYKWFAQAYANSSLKLPGFARLSLEQALQERKKELQAIRDPKQKSIAEMETGAWLHKLIKATIPRFSFERGFEFSNTVKLGERQCLLQSVLIAGLLQKMGVQAGAYMVWKNDRGRVSNLGHVTAVIKLSDGRDVLVDASEAVPFFQHQGLFGPVAGEYRFIQPNYAPDSTIRSYTVLKDGKTVGTDAVKPLDTAYLSSQFYYYRGERAPGGLMSNPKTDQGLADSARFLEQAIKLNPQNPLAVYVLGHVYLRQGKSDLANKQYLQGYRLYERFGYIPEGPMAAAKPLLP